MFSDSELVAAHLAGDRDAGGALVDRHYGTVLGFFRNKAPASAQDLTQQTFLECFASLDRLLETDRFRAFLFGIAHNLLLVHFRRRHGAHVDFSVASSANLDPSPSAMIAQHQSQQRLLDALRRIPLDHQVVLELTYWEELSGPEIAAILRIPLGTVRSRVQRARERLAEALAPDAPPEEQARLAAALDAQLTSPHP